MRHAFLGAMLVASAALPPLCAAEDAAVQSPVQGAAQLPAPGRVQSPTQGVVMTLQEAERRAVASSTALRIAELRRKAASMAHGLGVREFLPSFAVSVSSDQQVFIGGPDSSQVRWSLSLAQPIFNAGRSLAQRRLSAVELSLNERAAMDERDALLDEVSTAFTRLLVEREKLSIQEKTLTIASEQLGLARTEQRIGSLREVDVLETELEAAAVELDLREIQATLEAEEYELKRLTGLEPQDAVVLEGAIDAEYAGLELPVERERWAEMALAASDAIARKRLDVARSLEQLKIAESWFLPEVSLELTLALSGAGYPLQSPSATGTLRIRFPASAFPLQLSAARGGSSSSESQASIAASTPVLEDLSAGINRTLARAALQSEQITLADLQEELAFRIATQLSSLARRRDALRLERRKLEAQERQAAILQRQRELGEAKRIDHVRAQTALSRARIAILESVLDLLEQERGLELLLGLPRGGLAGLAASERKSP